METVAATFTTPEAARAALDALQSQYRDIQHVSLLMPGTPAREIEKRVPTEEGEPPGMGAAVGSVVGGAVGLATASLILPGVGPIIVAGMLAAGIVGAAGGGAIGDRVEEQLTQGIPRDELEAYKVALAHGRSVLIIGVESDEDAEAARQSLEAAGAESVDPAREDWLTGLKDPTSTVI